MSGKTEIAHPKTILLNFPWVNLLSLDVVLLQQIILDLVSHCLICKQEIKQGEKIDCSACGLSYHREHLKIHLRISRDCMNCQYEFSKDVIDQYDPVELEKGIDPLVQQLDRIFPLGPPPDVKIYYERNHPHGLTPDEYIKLYRTYIITPKRQQRLIQQQIDIESESNFEQKKESIFSNMFAIRLLLAFALIIFLFLV